MRGAYVPRLSRSYVRGASDLARRLKVDRLNTDSHNTQLQAQLQSTNAELAEKDGKPHGPCPLPVPGLKPGIMDMDVGMARRSDPHRYLTRGACWRCGAQR